MTKSNLNKKFLYATAAALFALASVSSCESMKSNKDSFKGKHGCKKTSSKSSK